MVDQFLLLKDRNIEHQAEVERMKTHCCYNHLKPIFTACHGIVSASALEKVQDHMQLFNLNKNTVLPACTSQFKTSMGLPCAHIIQERLQADELLQPSDFNTHWLLE